MESWRYRNWMQSIMDTFWQRRNFKYDYLIISWYYFLLINLINHSTIMLAWIGHLNDFSFDTKPPYYSLYELIWADLLPHISVTNASVPILDCTLFFQSSYLHSVCFTPHKFIYLPFDLIFTVWFNPSVYNSKIRDDANYGYCSQFKAVVCPFLYSYSMHLLVLKFKS